MFSGMMNMNMIDPRAFLLNPAIVYDASTLALLHQASANPSPQLVGGGKMLGNNSFRISDILSSSKASSEDKADTSGENDTLEGSDIRSPSNESSERLRSESPNSTCESSGGKKARKARTIFTDKQLQELENTFEKQKYLSVQDRMELAKRLGLSDTQVKTWYQNRRTKWKRQSAVGMEFLNDASNVSAVQNLLRTPYWANYFQTNPQTIFAQQRLCAPGAGFGIPSATQLIPGLHGLDPSAQIPMLFPAGLAASMASGIPLCSSAPSKISPSMDFALSAKENTESSSPSPPAPPISPKAISSPLKEYCICVLLLLPPRLRSRPP